MKTPIYLDNNATTRLDPRVLEEMLPVLKDHYGNASSSTHSFGWYAEELVQIAREKIAASINASSEEIIFTSGATESNNIVLKGAAKLLSRIERRQAKMLSIGTEHKSILEPLADLDEDGVDVSLLLTKKDGTICKEAFSEKLSEETDLISIMLANNEIGVIHDIASLVKIAREAAPNAFFHCDASQALGKIAIDVEELDIDFLSLSAHKLYGPKGVGALYLNKLLAMRPEPLLHGGGQEEGLRAGTLNVPAVVGFGKACEIVVQELDKDREHISGLTNTLREQLEKQIPALIVNGSLENRIPGNLNFAIPGIDANELSAKLSAKLAISTSSACSSANKTPSHVLAALGLPPELQKASLRIGIGRFNTAEEIDYAVETLARFLS